MENLISMIKEELKLMSDQIVSISIHDSKISHGDLEAVLFYRKLSIKDNSEPCECISFDITEFDEDISWETILNN
jgi:hypothetical protein